MTNKSIIALLILLVILGCSTRKVNRDKTEIDYSILDKGVIKVDSGKTKSNYNFDFDFTKGLKLRPIDTSKPMEIDGKKYKNAIFESTEHNKGTIKKEKDSTYFSAGENKNLKQDLNIEKDTKQTESKKQGFVFLYIGIASFIIALIFLYRWFRK